MINSVNITAQNSIQLTDPTSWVSYVQSTADRFFKGIFFTPTDLSKRIEPLSPSIEGYGNKHAGLMKVADYLEIHPIPGVTVPIPKGLSHESVEKFLRAKDPEIFSIWENLCHLFFPKTFVETILYYFYSPSLQNPTVLSTLENIRNRIETAFNTISEEELPFFADEDLSSWLKELSAKNAYLMVRSSGVEDSKELANAGGNLSEGYVAPNLQDILSASGRVVSSYFSPLSLKNRFTANTNPFDLPLVLPVMLHELIGEEVGGSSDEKEIPISLVLFTTEPNDSEADFHVTKISATFGHGEGVVGARNIASDTVHVIWSSVDPDTFFSAYQNRAKGTRLAPCKDPITGAISLESISNLEKLEYSRALDDSMVTRLALLAKELENAFDGHPMDVEIVIKNDIIHIVQARPVIRPKAKPSYFSLEGLLQHSSAKPLLDSFSPKVLTPGTGSCEIFTRTEEVLVCASLKTAEELFDKQKHRCVIVKEDEPANSHPIVNFSSLGIPCFYLPENSEKINSTPTSSIIICPQSSRIYSWDSSQLDPKSCIMEGYVSHPASIGLSLFDDQTTALPFPKRNIRPPEEISRLLRVLQEDRVSGVALKALSELKEVVKDEIQEMLKASVVLNQDPPFFLEKLQDKLERIWEELEITYTKPTLRLHKLFLIKSLSSLLTGQIEGSLSTYSLLDVKDVSKKLLRNISYKDKVSQTKQDPDWIEFAYFGDYFISKEMDTVWEEFLLSLEKIPLTDQILEDKIALRKIIDTLEKFSPSERFLGTFFNFICSSHLLSEPDASKILNSITAISPEEGLLLNILQEQNKQISQLKENLSLFEDPKSILSAQQKLFDLHLFFADQEKFINPTKTGTNFAKFIAAEVLKELVEVTDLAIKNIKISPHFSLEEKAKHMDAILKSNFELLSSWFTNLVPEAIENFLFSSLSRFSIEDYLQFIQSAWTRIPSNVSKNLLPSPDFSVGAAVVNSKANFSRHTPRTLEDIFTLIHQNQILAVSCLSFSKEKINALPNPLQASIKFVKDIIPSRASLYSIDTSFGSCKLQYNIPLSNHSAGLEIEYKKEDGSFLIHGKLFGQMRSRWPACFEYLQALNAAGGLRLSKAPRLSNQELLFTWAVQEEDIRTAIDQFNQFLDYSYLSDKNDIFDKIKYYLQNRTDVLVKVGKWFHDQKIFAPPLTRVYLDSLTNPIV